MFTGAFTDAVFYPLHDRGVCAVVGDNKDDRCADSNGAGKTTLVMAPMWALGEFLCTHISWPTKSRLRLTLATCPALGAATANTFSPPPRSHQRSAR